MLQSLTASYSQLLGAGLTFTIVVLAVYLLRRRMEDRRAKHKLADAIRLELNVPTSLHPVIDPDICIGSGSCISACPEGKILGLVDGVATLLNASKCIGHGKCAVECPVNAIRLVFGTEERGVELPEVDEFFETSRAGVHIVGELAGMGLIKNALTQGLQVAARFKETIEPSSVAGAFDVAIVGAGPAGIATAVGCKAAADQGRASTVVFGGFQKAGIRARKPSFHGIPFSESLQAFNRGNAGGRNHAYIRALIRGLDRLARSKIHRAQRTPQGGNRFQIAAHQDVLPIRNATFNSARVIGCAREASESCLTAFVVADLVMHGGTE